MGRGLERQMRGIARKNRQTKYKKTIHPNISIKVHKVTQLIEIGDDTIYIFISG